MKIEYKAKKSKTQKMTIYPCCISMKKALFETNEIQIFMLHQWWSTPKVTIGAHEISFCPFCGKEINTEEPTETVK